MYFLFPYDLLGFKERGRSAGVPRSQGPCVFKFALLSIYLRQMENVPELAGEPQGWGWVCLETHGAEVPQLSSPAQLCATECSSLPADL